MKTKHVAKITFFYLLSLFGLVFTALTSGMILFQIINRLIPEAINYRDRFSAEALRFAISAVIVASPVYYWMTFLIQRSLKKEELDKESQLRKWMSYLIIFVSAIVIIVSLIGVINNYLSGAFTNKIALKLLTTIVISGIVLSYYLYDLKRKEFSRTKVIKIYFWASLFLIITTLVGGFLISDSPAQIRKIKQDKNTIRDLNDIKFRIKEYSRNNGQLPKKLSDLDDEILTYSQSEKTINDYEYKVLNNNEYEICANFMTNSNADNNRYIGNEKQWTHEIGHKCFKIKDLKLKKEK